MKLVQKIIVFTVLSTLLCGCSRYLERDPPGIKTVYEPGPNTTIISHKVCDPGLQKTECDIRLHQANLLEKPNGKQLLEDERKRIAEQEKEASSWEINKFSSEESSGWKKIGFSLEEAIAWKSTGFKPEAAKQWRDKGFSSEQAKYITEQREIQRRLECHNNFPNPWNAYIGNPYALEGACVVLDLMAVKFFSKSRAIYQPVYRNSRNYFAIDFDNDAAPNFIYASFLLGKAIQVDGQEVGVIPILST